MLSLHLTFNLKTTSVVPSVFVSEQVNSVLSILLATNVNVPLTIG